MYYSDVCLLVFPWGVEAYGTLDEGLKEEKGWKELKIIEKFLKEEKENNWKEREELERKKNRWRKDS